MDMKKITNKSVVIKHSAIIQTSNEFTKLQRMAFNFMLFNAYDDLLKNKIHEIKVSELKKCLGIQKDDKNFNANNYIKNLVKKLVHRGLTIDVLGKSKKFVKESKMQKDGWDIKDGGNINLSLFSAIYTDKRSVIKYKFNEYLADFLYNPDIYSKIKLSMQQKFLNKYSIALYEICLDYIGIKQTPEIKLVDLKKLLLGNKPKKSYDQFFLFNSKVLKPAIKNVNEDTDIFITPEFIKKGRKIISVKFKIRVNPGTSTDEKQENLIEAINKSYTDKSPQERGMQSIQDILGNKQFIKKEIQDSPTNEKENKQYKENEEKVEFFVNTILNFTNHKDSINFYRKVAWAFVLSKKQDSIYDTIRAIEVDYRGKTVNKAKLFNSKIRESAKIRHIDLN